MNSRAKLIRNAIQTPDGTILESRHRHDYKTHKDENGETYMIDGGLDYIRTTINKTPPKSLAVYDSDPHELKRGACLWGTRGINGDQPLRYISVADMDTSHLEAVILTQQHLLPQFKQVMLDELHSRAGRNIE